MKLLYEFGPLPSFSHIDFIGGEKLNIVYTTQIWAANLMNYILVYYVSFDGGVVESRMVSLDTFKVIDRFYFFPRWKAVWRSIEGKAHD